MQFDIETGKEVGWRISKEGDAYGDGAHTLSDFLPVCETEVVIDVAQAFEYRDSRYLSLAFYTDEQRFISRPMMEFYTWPEMELHVPVPENAAYVRMSCPTSEYGTTVTLWHAGGGGSMSDPDIKTYGRGGRLAFTAGIMQGHVGETWTLSFWIRLAEGSVEGHTVLIYPYQNRGTAIGKSVEISPTAEWQLVQLTGAVRDYGTDDGSVYDGTSETYTYNGVVYTYGEMFMWDMTAYQKYEVYGVICAPADSGSGGGASMSTPARNLLHGALDLTGDVGTGTGTRTGGGTAGAAYSRTGCSRWAGPYINLKDALGRVGAQVGEKITLSIYVRTMAESEEPVECNFCLVRVKDNGTGYPTLNGTTTRFYYPELTPGEWMRLYSTFEVDEVTLAATTARFDANGLPGVPYEWSAPMLTLGDTLHPWRPAPEDTEQPSDVVYASEGVDLGDTSGDKLVANINLAGDTAKISASHVEINGQATFTAIKQYSDAAYDASGAATGAVDGLKTDLASASGTTVINGGHIETGSLTIGQVDSLQSTLNGKASTTDVANAAKRTYVSIRATAISYAADTATLEATLYIDGTATTTGVTYAWLVDGTAISGATARTYSVPASSGLDHAYSCKATW